MGGMGLWPVKVMALGPVASQGNGQWVMATTHTCLQRT